MAADFLIKKGFVLLQRNYRIRGGEIDIIAEYQDDVVFVEVKTLTQQSSYQPEDQVTASKRRRVERAALTWLQRQPRERHCRFDVVAISHGATTKIQHFENAWLAGD